MRIQFRDSRSLFCALALTVAAAAQQPYDVDAEIGRVKRELSKVESERQRVKKDIAGDRREFETYRERNAARSASIARETDSIVALTAKSNARNDSLGATMGGIESSLRQNELQQARLRELLAAQCDSFISFASVLPPLTSGPVRGSLEFLRSELQSGITDNMEALHRLVQIVRDIEAFSSEVQVVEGASVVPEIRGTTYRLRIGLFFEALVDSRGERAALWSSRRARWELFADQSAAAAVLKAVRIREGTSLPALVDLELGGASAPREEAANE